MYSVGKTRKNKNKSAGPRKRNREYNINEFVDSSRAIIGSSQEESCQDKVVNSDEEENIIKKKPAMRGPERRIA